MTLKILIAEDNVDIGKLYTATLESRGHKVVLTKNGKECMERYITELKSGNTKNSFPFDLVIVDQAMPIKDGATLVGEILDQRPNQRIIFATAHRDQVIKNFGKIRKAVEIFDKPFHLKNLIYAVESKTHKIPKQPLKKRGFRYWEDEGILFNAGPGPKRVIAIID